MKRIIAILLALSLILCGCDNSKSPEESVTTPSVTVSPGITSTDEVYPTEVTPTTDVVSPSNDVTISPSPVDENIDVKDSESEDITKTKEYIENLGFTSLYDQDFLQYINDTVYTDLEATFSSDDYQVVEVNSVYISKEYFEELDYNSKENIYFGYTISELDELFQGKKYVFTLDEEGKTGVKEFEEYQEIDLSSIIRNVSIGTGVILLCVTVSVISAGAGAPVISAIFAASAKGATTFALSSGVFSGLTAGVVEGIKTGDLKQAFNTAALQASEGFMYGAITGAIVGGASEGIKLSKLGKGVENGVKSGKPQDIGKASEKYVEEFYKDGKTQVSYLKGEQVSQVTEHATRPDIVIEKANGAIEAIEVKNYDLQKYLPRLKDELQRQVSERMINLPANSTQKIALVTKGRNYTDSFVKEVVKDLQESLFDAYGGRMIPIEVF